MSEDPKKYPYTYIDEDGAEVVVIDPYRMRAMGALEMAGETLPLNEFEEFVEFLRKEDEKPEDS